MSSRVKGSPPLAKLLETIEKFGGAVMFTRSVEKLVSADARAALHAAGVLRSAAPVVTWPCEERGCSREVRANYDGARRPLVAVCSRAPTECALVELSFEDVAQQQVRVDALVSAVCGALGAEVERAGIAKVRERFAIGDARAPVLVAKEAEESSGVRDVFWAGSPRDTDLAAFCARRERVTQRTLVLVPTGRHVSLEVASRFAVGEHVAVMAVGDVVDVHEGKIARRGADASDETPRRATTEPPPAPKKRKTTTPATMKPGHGLAAVLGVTRWEDLRISVLDEQTVKIETSETHVLRTFVELGFVDRRKRDGVVPVVGWAVFLGLCRNGQFRPSEYAVVGKAYGAKKGVEWVRRALKAAFGLEKDPMRGYSRASGWVPRFLGEKGKLGVVRKGG